MSQRFTEQSKLTVPLSTPESRSKSLEALLLDLSKLMDKDGVKRVPVRAVQADSGLKPRVWILDPKTMTVSGRDVSIGHMTGGMIQITDGLNGGEEIVSVGAPYLADGMQVTRMKMTEQAVPRADDPL